MYMGVVDILTLDETSALEHHMSNEIKLIKKIRLREKKPPKLGVMF